MIYEPREDSFMLEKWVKMLSKGKVLDVGTGSGIQAIAALDKAESVIAIDIQEEVVENMKKLIAENNYAITVKKSDLFKSILEKFDVIIFNPPYLPQDPGINDETIYGGKEGYEVVVKFLKQARYHLNPDGFILFLFSSFTNKKKVDKTLEELKYTWSELEVKGVDFEKLYVYKAWNT